MARRDLFTGLGQKLYHGPGLEKLPETFRSFERELERCYCSGAYIACIVLAHSVVEVFYKSVVNATERKRLLASLEYVSDELDWLRNKRNDYLHFGRPSNKLTRRAYTEARPELESEARRASALVYHVARGYVRL